MVHLLVYLGSALMVYNIVGFVRFARYVRRLKAWNAGTAILRIPIVLLILFLLGYLAVGFLGKPDLIVAGILFGGSIFVFAMYRLLRDVTRHIVANEELAVQLMAAEESGRAKEVFLASVSHEMRTPMNVILGLNNAALNEPGLTRELREKLEKINLSAQHLLGLINNILEMNRLESNSFELHREAFSLSEALGQVNAIVRTLCDEKGLDYRVAARDCVNGRYVGDVLHIKKVLLSILDNAVKYTDAPGAVSLDAACAETAENVRTIRFTVSDTGVGIDEAFLPHLFRAFAQEDASFTTRFGGGGLSLAVTKQIVDRMGGTITAQSEKGVGSVFTVTLPLECAAEEAEAPAPPAGEAVSLAGRRILIAEDVAENAEIVADLLELEDAETEHAECGKAALDMFAASPPGYYDAILMDLRMPVMDGWEATRRIRSLERPDAKSVPIIALTANAFESDIQQSLAAGMNAHLAKPADADMLYDTLRRFIGRTA